MRIETLCAALICAGWPLAAQTPLSAIDWLDAQANVPQLAPPARLASEPPVAQTALVPQVETQALGAPSAEAVGLLPRQVTGLPLSLWQNSESERLSDLIRTVDPAVPALSALLHTLLLAEANPPQGHEEGQSLLAARLDRLVDQGVLDPALALLERADARTPELFDRWFDIALLTGREEAACAALMQDPRLSQALSTRIYCTARTGQYGVAVTVLETGRALGTLSARDATLLRRFLEPELADMATPLIPPARPTPLQFRLFEAIGEALPTIPLPRAFANVDLTGDSGWKAQLEAAERLTRVGAISGNQLLGIYSMRRRAASGGVWDRVEAVQDFESALETGNPDRIAPALTAAWAQMRSARLLVPFSELFGPGLLDFELPQRARAMAENAALLSRSYETSARRIDAKTPELAFLRTIAQGAPVPAAPPDLPHANAIAQAFGTADLPAELASKLARGQLGEVILLAMSLFSSGAEGNPTDLTDAIATLRAVGLEDTARRAALQLVILDLEGVRR